MLNMNGFDNERVCARSIKRAYAMLSTEFTGKGKEFYKKVEILIVNKKKANSNGCVAGEVIYNPADGKVHIVVYVQAFREFYNRGFKTVETLSMKFLETFRHEMRHVAQYKNLEYLFNRDTIKTHLFMQKMYKSFANYWDNPLEVDARAHESIGFAKTSCMNVMQNLIKLYA